MTSRRDHALTPGSTLPLPDPARAGPELRLGQRLLYAGAAVGGNVTDMAVVTWAMFYYAPPAGHGPSLAPIAWIGTALVLGRVVDAVVNPLVGFWSDRSRNRRGRRLPFLMAAGLPMVLTFLAFWFPPAAGNSAWNGLYAAAVLIVFHFFYTVYFCPYGALLPEIASGSGERVSTSVLVAVCTLLGSVLVGVLSGYLVTRLGYRATAVLFGLLALPFLYGPVLAIREKTLGAAEDVSAFSFRQAVIETLRNRPFLIYVGATVFALLAQNMLMVSLPYFVTVVMRGTESQMGYLMGGSLAVATFTFPMVSKLAERWGKARVFGGSLLFGGFIFTSLFFVGRFDLPISPLGQMGVIVALSGFAFAPAMALPPAILADAIDHEYENTGKRRSAMYWGVQGILQKSAVALGPALVSTLFSLFGYSFERPLGIYLVGPVGGFLLVAGWSVFRLYPLKER